MTVDYNKLTVQLEPPTEELYNFISSYFNTYLDKDCFINRNDLTIATLKEDDKLLGVILLKNEKEVQKIKIVYTVIDEKYRGLNLNKYLLDFTYNFAKDINYKCLIAHIRESNQPSIKSFIKYGFKINNKVNKTYSDTKEKKIRVFKKIRYNSMLLTVQLERKLNDVINKEVKMDSIVIGKVVKYDTITGEAIVEIFAEKSIDMAWKTPNNIGISSRGNYE
ncbi:MAG: GNAT family N-acetyltransferase [Saccharofermentanales bacterium]